MKIGKKTKATAVAVAAVGALFLSSNSASAYVGGIWVLDGSGNLAMTPGGCIAGLNDYSTNWGQGKVWAYTVPCTVSLQQRNIVTGGYKTPDYVTVPAYQSAVTPSEYQGDGVHQLQVCFHDSTGWGGCTAWIG